MKKKLFYRLEHKETKCGVYSMGGEVSEIMIKFWNPKQHPGPDEDSKMSKKWDKLKFSEKRDYIFGFANLEQYRSWFANDKDLFNLSAHDIVLNSYETEHYIVGHAQMVARKETLKFVETFPILGK